MADNLLNRNSIRLLREAWSTPAALAQELFMIASDEPVDQARPRTPQVQARIERAAANAPPQPAARQAAIVRPPQPSLGDQMRQRIAAASAFTFPSAPTNSSASVPGGGPVDLGLPRNGGTAVAPIAYASQWTGGVPGNPRRPTQQPGVQASQTGQPGRSADASTSPPRERVSSPQPAPPAFPGSVRGEEPPAMAGQARERSEPAPVQSAATPVAARALDVPSQGTRVPVRAVDRADPFSVRTASGFVNLRSGQIAVTRPRRSAPPAPDRPSGNPLPAAPHAAFDYPPTDPNDAYQPFGLAGAYSGMERLAGDHLPHDYPTIERDHSDPFARKYYDLRFYPTDWDSPRPSGGGGGTTSYVGQLVDDSSGLSCQVQLFPDGPAGDPGETVTVQILQLAPSETIPSGTWLWGIQKTGSTYCGQVPIWL